MTSTTVPNCNDARHPETLPHDDAFASGVCTGLTKREFMATEALKGLLACPHQMCTDIDNQVGLAVDYADQLIAELNRTAKGVL